VSTHGYSDRINHALAFAAKYMTPRGQSGSGMQHFSRPANVAVVLARYDCDESTIIAGILSNVVGEAFWTLRIQLEPKIEEKFGTVVAGIVREAAEPRFDARGRERNWEVCRMDYLANLAAASPRALDVCTANQIHFCASTLTDIRRLGVEYLSTFAEANRDQTLWWYGSVISALEGLATGPRAGMLIELRGLADLLARELERSDPG
jgi:(p)ppGpp synthase/HD superfamily hydrolase